VLQNGPTDIFVLTKEDGGEVMIPRVKEFIPFISVTDKKMTITPIEGLL